MDEEKMERRLEGVERNFRISLILVLVSLSCSLAALITALVVLLIT